MNDQFSHIDNAGKAAMVDISDKAASVRIARAKALVSMLPATLELIVNGGHHKGDVFAVARIAGIQAAKKCSELIPLCHPLLLSSVQVELHPLQDTSQVEIIAECKLRGSTGVEMEALTACSVAALTLYDMCKAVDKGMVISSIQLLEKQGGRSGHWQAGEQ